MRAELEKSLGNRATFRARVERYGTKHGGGETILLRDVVDANGQIVADHLWLAVGVGLRRLAARAGEFIEFDATVATYVKGYRGKRDIDAPPVSLDYKLANARSLRRLDSDGLEIDLNGPPRVVRTEAGWFALRNGLLYPCDSREQAEAKVLAG